VSVLSIAPIEYIEQSSYSAAAPISLSRDHTSRQRWGREVVMDGSKVEVTSKLWDKQ
jgi:hypothetical protein